MRDRRRPGSRCSSTSLRAQVGEIIGVCAGLAEEKESAAAYRTVLGPSMLPLPQHPCQLETPSSHLYTESSNGTAQRRGESQKITTARIYMFYRKIGSLLALANLITILYNLLTPSLYFSCALCSHVTRHLPTACLSDPLSDVSRPHLGN